jgi:TatD DNase family protein
MLKELESLAAGAKTVAIGEVGLDYFRLLRRPPSAGLLAMTEGAGGGSSDDEVKEDQKSAFKKFIELALRLNKPLIIHSRDAEDDVLSILKDAIRMTHGARRAPGVIHCFSGSRRFLEECLRLGFYVSFTCNLTFRNAKKLRELAKDVPIERVLLETDAPYLAPEGMRGKRNEPAYLEYLVGEWSRLTGLSKEDIERITTHNAGRLFGLGLSPEKAKVAYSIRDSLYLNITNRCTNNCYFCVRQQTVFVKGHNLKLDAEPSVDEIIKAVGDPSAYKEIVFCGYGEPTTRLDAVKDVARYLKSKGSKVRLVTNGHGDLINKKPIAAELSGLVDSVSVSLNTDDEKLYEKICKPEFGAAAHAAVLKFIKDCVAAGMRTEVTCLDLPEIDISACEKAARGLGAAFRQRDYGVTG